MSRVPWEPTVLDTTVPSNFAYVDRLDVVTVLPRICTVPAVRTELRRGVDSYPYLQRALDQLDDAIPIVELDETCNERASELKSRLDPGEAQAVAVADCHGGTVVTDDGPARTLARDTGVPVTGSIGVLLRAVEGGQIDESTADRWLRRWVEETDYRAPSKNFEDYR